MSIRIGSLFSGYEGIGLALREVFGTVEHVFVADVCKVNKDGSVGHHEPHRAPCSILAHRFPDVPNLGDVSLIDWSPWRGQVDILTAGFPCQDVSVAGGRAGLRDGTRTGLWSEVVRAITELNPRLVVLENVPGIFTAPAAGDVEPCPVCLGDGSGEHLRALDAVLADLAAIGFDADWTVVPASGVGAAHKRERWFCLAYPAGQPWSFEHGDGGAAADSGHRAADRQRPRAESGQGSLLPSPRTSDTNGAGVHGDGGLDLRTAIALLPTPSAERAGRNKSASEGAAVRWGLDYIDRLLPTPSVADSTGGHERRGGERGEELLLKGVVRAAVEGTLLPTPRATDGTKGGPNQRGSSGDLMLPSAVNLLPTPMAGDAKMARNSTAERKSEPPTGIHAGDTLGDISHADRWGEYGPAIRRWEALTRPAPEPTKLSAKGNPKLSDEFDEWLMGLPKGWITDVPGITWNETLKACGNGVVIQQVVEAVRHLLTREQVA